MTFRMKDTFRKAALKKAESVLPESVVEFIDSVKKEKNSRSRLISVLHKLQSEEGYLGTEQMDAVAQLMDIPASEVSGVATFYHFFQLKKPGRFVISVCMGTACYVKGADKVFERVTEELGISLGETTSDGLFSLQQTRCLGTCGLAPVLTVNEKVFERVTPDRISGILEHYIRLAHEEEQD